jgi:hypothetical protein|tara:strand:- start:71 stop:235 length:165 start_codon:yes stop_codon:yes gene_type:complete
MESIKKMQRGGSAPFDIQVAFNILAVLFAIKIYDSFLKDKYYEGKTIDELVGLK